MVTSVSEVSCLGLVLASDPEDTSLTDVTIHRLCVQERDELSMFLAAGRHIEVFRKKAEAAGKPNVDSRVKSHIDGYRQRFARRFGLLAKDFDMATGGKEHREFISLLHRRANRCR